MTEGISRTLIRTRIQAVRSDAPNRQGVREAAQILQGGGRVAFPTETVYGLGALALDARAVGGIFEAKGRPADNPLIVHVADEAMAARVVADVNDTARDLMHAFWPGALTLVLPRAAGVPSVTTAGLSTVAVRVPDHDVARTLIQEAGAPLAAPSANRSGSPSPTTAGHVLQDLDGRIEMIIDGGPCRLGVESTVVDARGLVPVILRPGTVTAEAIHDLVGAVTDGAAGRGRRSPGTNHRHYTPQARVEVAEGPGAVASLAARYGVLRDQAKAVHVVLSQEGAAAWPHRLADVTVLGARADHAAWGARLYGVLRAADSRGDAHLLIEGIEARGVGVAIMDRLRRAAAP